MNMFSGNEYANVIISPNLGEIEVAQMPVSERNKRV